MIGVSHDLVSSWLSLASLVVGSCRMKIGIFSDLHLEFGDWNYDKFQDDIFYINAGDTHPDPRERLNFLARMKKCFYIRGNHDYYGASFLHADLHFDSIVRSGIKIAGAVLWTDLISPTNWNLYQTGLIDSRYIKDLTQDRYMNAHDIHKNFLLTSDADVIVSHHAPSYLSVSSRYKGDAYNPCFATELYEDIINMKKPPKLWIHGHMHNRSDYMIGDTRVICHPRGYPNENEWYQNYEPLIVEI